MSVIVTIIVIGLVGVYAPLLFTKPQIVSEPGDENYVPPETASLLPPQISPTSTPSSTDVAPSQPLPEGFSGLDEEDQKLRDLDRQLGN